MATTGIGSPTAQRYSNSDTSTAVGYFSTKPRRRRRTRVFGAHARRLARDMRPFWTIKSQQPRAGAYLPENEQGELIAEMTLTKQGPNTITSKKALREELHAILEEDFAVNDEELTAGLYAIAAPARNEARDVVAALNLVADSSMISLENLADELGPHLISTADRISARLGYRRADETN
jgi:Bacterial transcriptional regulator